MMQIVHLRILNQPYQYYYLLLLLRTKYFVIVLLIEVHSDFIKFLKQKKMLKEIIMLFVFTVLHAQYTLNLDFPFLLDNLHANITTVKWDKLNGFHVAFRNKQYRHYSFDFSNYTSYNLSYVIQQISSWRYEITSVYLSNGTTWNSKSSMNVAFSNHHRTMRVYNQTTMNEIQSYTFNETVICNLGIPVEFSPNFIPHHVLITNQTLKIIYKGVVNIALNFSHDYTLGTICNSAIYITGFLTKVTDSFQGAYYFTAALNTRQLLNISLVLYFTMNYTSSTFDMTYNISKFTIFTPNDAINKMFLMNSLVLMQSTVNGTMYIYNSPTYTVGTVDNLIPKNQVFTFLYKFNNYYILNSNGLIQVSFNGGTNTLSYINSISSLPFNIYSIALGTQLDVFYIPNAPYIYKAGLCINQSLFDGVSSCMSYSCTNFDCFSCSLTSTVCSICNSGYTRDDLYQCSNSTINLNSTNTNNSQENNTYSSNQSISIYSSNNYSSSLFFFFDIQWIYDLLAFLIELVKNIIAVPAARKIVTPLFYYFSNFDDLYLYSLHNREYSDAINSLFQQIANIENKKWTILSFQQVCRYTGMNSSKIIQILQFQQNYLLYSTEKETNSEGLLSNCINFLLIEVLIIFLAFIIFRTIFIGISKFSISQIFRRFDFWIYILILIFEGNVQQFTFYLTKQLRVIFAFECANKFVKVFIIFFGHSLFIFSVGGYFIGLSFYKKLNRYFTDNNKNNLHGNLLLILQNGIRNIILGVVHSSLRNKDYQYLIGPLIMTEVVFFIMFLLGISYRLYIENSKVWIYLILTFIRLLLIVTFALDRTCINYITFSQIQILLIFIMVSLSIISFLLSIYDLLKAIKRFFTSCLCISKKSSHPSPQQVLIAQPRHMDRTIQRISFDNRAIKKSLKNFQMKIKGAVIFLIKPSIK